MMTKKVDATLGAFWNYEGVQLRLQKRAPEDHPDGERRRADLPGARHRRPRAQDLAKGGERVRRFMRALGQGHAALRQTRQAGVEPLLKANPDLDPELQLESVKATLPVFFPARGQAVRLDGAAPSGRATATGCTPTSCSAARPTRRAR